MELIKFIATTIHEYLNENKNTNKRKSRFEYLYIWRKI